MNKDINKKNKKSNRQANSIRDDNISESNESRNKRD